MKRFYTLCVTLLVFNSLINIANAQDESTWMPDANLRNVVRIALDLNADEPLTQEKMLNLNVLNASQLEITSLTGLEYAINLRSLSISSNRVSDLTPLANLTNLTRLYIGGNGISDISPLANLTNLTRLYIGGNSISDISPLANLINLKRLGMLYNQITDISVLAGLVNLEYLRLAGNPITDTCPLASLLKLSDVDIEIPSLIRDVNLRAAVRATLDVETGLCITTDTMKGLTTLNASRLGITSLVGLEYAINLRSLSISSNRVSDLTPLANLTRLTRLYIDDNVISDISPLANLINLKRLEARRNQISDISVLAGLVNLKYLRLAVNPIIDTCPLINLPKLTDVDVYISCPPQEDDKRAQGEQTNVDTGPPQEARGQSQNGQSQFTQQSDGEFTATQAISITVTGNQIPILPTALPSRIFLEINGASKVVDVSSNFSDPNGDSLVYTAVSSNTNVATVSVNGSQVRITPRRRGTDQIQAIADITVSASDGQSSVSDTIEVWVTGPLDEAPVNEVEAPSENQPPVAVGTIAPVTRVKKPIWQVYSVGVSNNFSDPNGDTLSYTANSHDSDVVTASANGPFIEIFLVGAGSTMVTVTASDGEFTATQTISVTVTAPEVRPGNRAPVAVGTIALTLTEGGESEVVDVSSNFSDPDGDPLTYTLIMEYPYDPNVAVVAVRNTPGIYVVIPRGVGSTAVKIEVSDGWLTATQTLSITVTASEGAGANHAPVQTRVSSPVTTALLPNYPNPFNPETWIPYHLAKDNNIEITIYDARGTIVRRLELGHQSAGYYTKRNRAAYWNGRNTLGEQVPSGVYFYHLQAGNVSLLRKMVILK